MKIYSTESILFFLKKRKRDRLNFIFYLSKALHQCMKNLWIDKQTIIKTDYYLQVIVLVNKSSVVSCTTVLKIVYLP